MSDRLSYTTKTHNPFKANLATDGQEINVKLVGYLFNYFLVRPYR